MSPHISLREAEHKAFVSRYQDGLIDLFIGSVVLMFVIGPFLTPYLGDFWGSAVFLPFWGLVWLVLWLLKKKVVQPRIGVATYGAWRKTRLLRFNFAMLFVGVLALILGILSMVHFDSVPGWMHTARFSLIMLIGFSACAYFLEFKRLYLYGMLIALSPLVGELLYVYAGAPHHGFPITFGFTAGLIILTGLLLFLRLLRDYPLPPNTMDIESGN